MSNCNYRRATIAYKELKRIGWIAEDISRAKAIRAIAMLIATRPYGDLPIPSNGYPYVAPLLEKDKLYNLNYINRAFGTMRYLNGQYKGNKK